MHANKKTVNFVGSQLVLDILDKKISASEAIARMRALTDKSNAAAKNKHNVCQVGAHGICLSHGQEIGDCQRSLDANL